MKAVLYRHAGGPEVLEHIEVPDPEPGARDVVIEVAACALNRLDVVQRHGWYQMPGFAYPHIAGMDLAGNVVAVGSEVTTVAVGDRVVADPSLAGVPEGSNLSGRGDLYGELGIIGATVDGGYAERCLVPDTHVYPVPDDMSLEHAATFPTCYLTAAHALFDVGRLTAGETVMIHAAGSGVSVAAIQLAKRAGATVLATAGSDDKLDRARADWRRPCVQQPHRRHHRIRPRCHRRPRGGHGVRPRRHRAVRTFVVRHRRPGPPGQLWEHER